MASYGADLAPLVRRLGLHSSLTTAEQDAILDLPARITTLKPHARLYRQGEVAQQCTVLLTGYACRSTLLPDGGRQILSLPMPGDLVDGDRLAAARIDHGAEMITAGRTATIATAAIEGAIALYPNISRAFWRTAVAEAAVQREWIVNVGRRRAHARIPHLLCELAVRHEMLRLGDRDGFPWVMTQSQLGDCAGLTSVHVNRVMRSLRDAGLIDGDKRRLIVADWAGLCALGGFDEAYLRGRPHAATRRPVAMETVGRFEQRVM